MADSGGLDCFSGGDEGLLGLRVGGLFAILVSSAIGVGIPFGAYLEKRKIVFFYMNAFAAGVVLTTGKQRVSA